MQLTLDFRHLGTLDCSSLNLNRRIRATLTPLPHPTRTGMTNPHPETEKMRSLWMSPSLLVKQQLRC